MKKTVLLFAVLAATASACSFFKKDDPADKERKLMEQMLHNNTSLLYKAFKISLRSFPTLSSQQGEAKLKAEKMQALALSMMQKLAGNAEQAKQPGLDDYVGAAAELYTLKGTIESTDEEQYPTILENVMYVAGNASLSAPASVFKDFAWYNTSYEHLLLGATWMGVPTAPREFQVYEMNAINTSKISEPHVKLVAELGRALTFYDQSWYYLSENECTAYLADLESQKATIGTIFTIPIFPGETKNTAEARYYELHGAGLMMRGVDKVSSAREDEAMEDFEGFISDMDKAGVSNESVWLIGCYVSLKKENKEQAIAYLDKLEQSDLYSENEKKAIREIKDYVSKREEKKVMNRLFDKIFIAKIAYSYASSALQNTSGYKQLKNDPTGNRFLGLPQEVNTTYSQLNAMQGDSLGSKAKDLVKDIFN